MKGIAKDKIDVIPPAPDDAVSYDEEGREAFRREHNIADRFVVMYAGNHSPCHPLDTLLLAAQELKFRDDIAFLFVGGGSEVEKVRSFAGPHKLQNIRHLPYQAQARLSALLSAADLHVVVMGEGFGGIVHPSKIYNILKVGAPFLFIGPEAGFISDIVAAAPSELVAMRTEHGHIEEVVSFISRMADRHRENQSGALASRRDCSSPSGFSRFIAHIEAVGPQTSPARLGAVGTSADIV